MPSMDTRQDLDAYFRMDEFPTRQVAITKRFDGLDRHDAINQARDSLADIQAQRAEMARQFDIAENDLRRWMNWRREISMPADIEAADKRATRIANQEAQRQARLDAKRAATSAKAAATRAKKREKAIRDGDYTKVLNSKAASMAEKLRAHIAMTLDVMVQCGLISVGYRKRALDQKFSLERINMDATSGNASR
jgi:hypothetical protein